MRANRELQKQIVRYAQDMASRGWVANHDGNLTARVAPGRFLATPTATSKADVNAANLIEVDAAGVVIAGRARRFSEIGLHLRVYDARDDVNAVVHAHPPAATALACSGSSLLTRPFIAEAVVSIGATIPTVPFALPGKDAEAALAAVLGDVDAALLENHGVVAWGKDLEQAYLRLELVEHLARIALMAQDAGGVRPLPEATIASLLAKRASAGLGAAADKAATQTARKRVVACAPAPHASVDVIALGGSSTASRGGSGVASPAKTDIAGIVREELLRALRESR